LPNTVTSSFETGGIVAPSTVYKCIIILSVSRHFAVMRSGAPRTVTIVENMNSLTFSQLCICKISWEAILENSTPAFRDMQKRPDFFYSSSAVWFHGVFTEFFS
jgi:hypothetical protein